MKLKSLKIKSYRSCINTKLDVQKDLTALIGINSSGKSNILNAVLLLKKISNFSRHNFYRERDSSFNKSSLEVEIEYKSKPVFIKAKIYYETDEENDDEIINLETTWDFSQLLKRTSPTVIPTEMFRFHSFMFDNRLRRMRRNNIHLGNWKINLNQAKQLHKILPHANNILRGFTKISYYGASQFSDPSQCPNFIEIEEERLVKKYRSDERHERFITDLYQSYKDKKNNKYELYLNTVNKSGIGLVDTISFQEVSIPSSSYKVMSGGQVKTFPRNRLLVVPNFNIDDNILSPSQLSEGTFRTLALLYYLLTDDNDLLLVEEPEVCVHHGLLSSIISLIKSQSKNKQIIISTHSDFVLDHLEPDNIVLIDRVANKGTLAKSLTKSMAKSEYRGLRMYLKESGNLGDFWKESGFKDEK